MTAWRKDPPTVDEVKACAWWWWRPVGGEWVPLRLKVAAPDLHNRDPRVLYAVDEDEDYWRTLNGLLPGGDWASNPTPDSAPPAFPPEAAEAARETIRIAESNADPIEVADAGLALARLVLGACPHAITTTRLADGELAPDERRVAEEHIAGCVECQGTVGDALQLAALAHDPPR